MYIKKSKVGFELNSKVGNILPSCAEASNDYRSWKLEARCPTPSVVPNPDGG